MKRWTEYIYNCAPSLPDCPELLIHDAIRDAAIEFCEHTFCWQDTIDARVTPTDRDIELTTNDDNIQIVRVMWIGGSEQGMAFSAPVAATPQWLDDNLYNWRYMLGVPTHYTMPLRGSILWLAPHPAIPITIDLQVALKPGPFSIEGPDDLYNDYRNAIQSGAIARCAVIPNKAWTNLQLVAMHAGNFNHWRDIALLRASRGNTKAPIRIKADHRW
jgi:hypothetical protein